MQSEEEHIYCLGEPFDSNHQWAMEYHKLKNYMLVSHEGEWECLSVEDKLEYCYSLFKVIPESNLRIIRQVEIFQKLINLDFHRFIYENVIECIFIEYNEYGVSRTINIPYNPLVPQKFYANYMKKLKKESSVGTLQIPTENTSEYLKYLLHIWFQHSYNNLTAYAIATKFYDLEDHKQIARHLATIKKLHTATKFQ